MKNVRTLCIDWQRRSCVCLRSGATTTTYSDLGNKPLTVSLVRSGIRRRPMSMQRFGAACPVRGTVGRGAPSKLDVVHPRHAHRRHACESECISTAHSSCMTMLGHWPGPSSTCIAVMLCPNRPARAQQLGSTPPPPFAGGSKWDAHQTQQQSTSEVALRMGRCKRQVS